MTQIILLIAQSETFEDGNYLRLGNELIKRGHQVQCCFFDSIAMHASEIVAQGFPLAAAAKHGDAFPPFKTISLKDADVVWILTLGMRQSFLDKVQLLHCLTDHCTLMNSLESLMHFKSKYFLASQAHVFKHPLTYTSTDPEELMAIIRQKGGRWIAKPPAGSLGRDVYLLTEKDPNCHVILESMTGPDADQFCLLQPYIEEIQQGEKRVVFAGGKVVGQYLRHANRDHRTNVLTGAGIAPCELSPEEASYCEGIGEFLIQHGAQFVGMDLVYPYVVEFNVVNPGGILTLDELGGTDITSAVIDQIFG